MTVDPLMNPTISSLKGQQSKKERKLKYADLAVQGTNNSSIASKRSVESIYLPKLGVNKNVMDQSVREYFKYFVPKVINRSPCINRGYWLRLHAIRSRLESIRDGSGSKKVLVVNLGCGFDPLPFQLLDKLNGDSESFLERFSFLDIDYSDLLKNKIEIIKQHPELTQIVGLKDTKGVTDTITCDQYFTRPCDLNSTLNYKKLLLESQDLPELQDPNVVKVFIAEVSLAYMKSELSDQIINISSMLPNSHFLMLEQLTPQGDYEPFSKQMLKHFKKNDSPLQSVKTYNTIESQRERFHNLGFLNINEGDMLQLWNSVPPKTRHAVEAIQPFDEFEEFCLFCHHYVLCHATNDLGFIFTEQYKFDLEPIIEIPENDMAVTFVPLDLDLKRSFGAGIIDSNGNVIYHGGCNPNRINETLLITENVTQSTPCEKTTTMPPVRTCHTFTRILETTQGIVIGGRNAPHKPYNDTWLYNYKTNEWTLKDGKLPKTRFRHCTVPISNDKLLIFGGVTQDTNTFLIYDLKKDSYEKVEIVDNATQFPNIVSSASMSYDMETNTGFIVGGLDEYHNVILETLYSFTIADNEITITEVMRHPLLRRYGAKSVHLSHGKILLVGGISSDLLFNDKTNIVIIDYIKRTVESVKIPANIWETIPLCFVGFDLLQVDSNRIVIVGGAATCYGFGNITNNSLMLTFSNQCC